MCPANGELENGDPEAPVDFLCRVAHLRAYALRSAGARRTASVKYCEGGEGYEEMMRSVAKLKQPAPDGGASGRSKMLPDAGGAVCGRLRQRRLLVVLGALRAPAAREPRNARQMTLKVGQTERQR